MPTRSPLAMPRASSARASRVVRSPELPVAGPEALRADDERVAVRPARDRAAQVVADGFAEQGRCRSAVQIREAAHSGLIIVGGCVRSAAGIPCGCGRMGGAGGAIESQGGDDGQAGASRQRGRSVAAALHPRHGRGGGRRGRPRAGRAARVRGAGAGPLRSGARGCARCWRGPRRAAASTAATSRRPASSRCTGSRSP